MVKLGWSFDVIELDGWMAVMDRCCCSGRFVRGENYNNGDHETLTKCKSMVLDMDKKMYNDRASNLDFYRKRSIRRSDLQ